MIEKNAFEAPLKVLMVPFLPLSLIAGGQEVQLRETMKSLEALSVDVRILDYQDKTAIEWADVVHIFDLNNFHVGLHIAAVTKKPIVLSSVFYEQSFLKRTAIRVYRRVPKTLPIYYRKLMNQSAFILPNSQAEARQIQGLFGINAEKFRIIPNGVDIHIPKGDAERFRANYLKTWNYRDGVVLSAHRIEDRKNSLNLVKACAAGRIPLILAGLRPETSYAREVMAIVAANDCIIHVGQLNKEDLRDAYAFAHVHALPSFMETPGLSSIEAGLAGCNLVVGACPPVNEYFRNHAHICDQSTEGIRKALAEARKEGRNAKGQKDYFRQNFAWEIAGKKTLEAYREAISNMSGTIPKQGTKP